jgi:hypothetical protein
MKGYAMRSLKPLCLLAAILALGTAASLGQDLPPPLPPVPDPVPLDKPVVEILATDPTGLTDASSGAFTVVRTGSVEGKLTLAYTISGTAENGVDYTTVDGQKLAGTITIPEQYAAADIVIIPRVNAPNRGNKTVTLTLSTSTDYTIGKHAKATVRIIDDLYNDKPPAVVLTVTGGAAGADGAQTFALPATVKLAAEATDSDDKVVKVSFYADDRFLGSDAEAPFELEWKNPKPGTYDLFARAVDQFGKSTLSAAVRVVVTATAPTVKITSPAEASVLPGPDVKITAEVAAGSGQITKVQFYGDGRKLATLTNAPYEMTWTKVRAGQHEITVRATDEFGQTASASVTIKTGNQPPVVIITSPKATDTFQAPATIELAAQVTDPENNAIDHVSFYANGRRLGSVTKAPFTLTWKDVRAGSYVLKASATDELGARSVSEAVKVTVAK